jgi:pimeloyl-ACP methyl ester carboxylesterase
MTLRMIGGGRGGPLLVLLHGLGASADVWHGVAEHWTGAGSHPTCPVTAARIRCGATPSAR